jgi:hypothetical protein
MEEMHISLEQSKAHEQIPPVFASSLSGRCPNQWIHVLDLAEKSAVRGVRMSLKSLWSGYSLENRGTQAYTFEKNCYILLRHKFSNQLARQLEIFQRRSQVRDYIMIQLDSSCP